MKKRVYTNTVLLAIAILLSGFVQGQDVQKDYSEIHFYRPAKAFIHGTASINLNIIIDDKNIGSLLDATKLEYKLYGEKDVKIKCVANFANGNVGKPFVTTIHVKNGEDYHISLSIMSITLSIKATFLQDAKLAEIQAKKYVDTILVDEKEVKSHETEVATDKPYKSKAARLKELKQLLKDELITQEEYDEAHKKIINE
jgi:hypothetical protein